MSDCPSCGIAHVPLHLGPGSPARVSTSYQVGIPGSYKPPSSIPVYVPQVGDFSGPPPSVSVDSLSALAKKRETQVPTTSLTSNDTPPTPTPSQCGPAPIIDLCTPPNTEPVTPPYTLPIDWLKAEAVDCMEILGRVGRKLSKFVGTGYVHVANGRACISQVIPLMLKRVWSNWIVPAPGAAPIPTDPKPYPYQVVGDIDGNLYVARGLTGQESISIWNPTTNMWEIKPTTEFPMCKKGVLEKSSSIELIGLDPVTDGNPDDASRCAKSLKDEGLLFSKHRPRPFRTPSCDVAACSDPLANVSTVVQSLAFPTIDGCYGIKITSGVVSWCPVDPLP